MTPKTKAFSKQDLFRWWRYVANEPLKESDMEQTFSDWFRGNGTGHARKPFEQTKLKELTK